MSGFEWRRVPAGLDASRWVARGDGHTVLVMIHAAADRQHLLDVVRLVEPDSRIKVAFTTAPGACAQRMERFLQDAGAVVVPSWQVREYEFGLAIAMDGGAIREEVRAPLIVLPQRVECRQMAIGGVGEYAVGSGPAYGGYPRPHRRNGGARHAVIVVSHEADVARLGHVRTGSRSVAVVGDSSFDRLVVSLPLRDFYRRALGIGRGQKLVVVAPGWDTRFLSGQWHELLARLLAELPPDEYRVLALFHPAVWSLEEHAGPADSLRRGLSLLPPEADWRAPLVAADWIVGDQASAALYGAVTGAPVLLRSAFPESRIDPDSGMGELAKAASRLSSRHSIRAQLHRAAGTHEPDRYRPVIERITSEPGSFNRNMRRLMYRLLELGQPPTIPTTDPVSPPFRID